MAEDYYKTLGIRRDASQAEIQKAYRELARKYHPDLNPDDKAAKQKFQQIQAAFDVLGDAEKREMYDRYGSSFETWGAGGPQGAHPWSGGFGGGPEGFRVEDIDLSQIFGERPGEPAGSPLGDIFSQFRRSTGGRSRKAARSRRGDDITHEVQIPFGTAISGGEMQITVRRKTGKTETISVKVPPGIEDGKKIRVRGQGEPGPRRGSPGDILITVRVAPHPCFQRRGSHLLVKVPVTLAEAVLGATVDVPAPRGTVSLRVPPGTSSGTKLRVKGQGAAPRSGPPGDLLAEIQIILPSAIDDEGRKLIRQFGERYAEDPRADLKW
jgi:DnaJ-class molecular chaperone